MIYPCSCIYKKHRKVLAWEGREVGGDVFIKDTSTGCLLVCESVSELKERLGKECESRFCDENDEIDFDEFWVSVKNLKTGRASSIKTCKILLDGWNFMEDLIRTIGQESDLLRLRYSMLDRIYEKLFGGINLIPVIPEGTTYHPVWKQEEVFIFRREMRRIWKEFFLKIW